METMANNLINTGVQCWTCPIFDSLFAIISNTAGAAYYRLTVFSVIIFCVLFAFYALNAVWQNIKNGGKDSFFQKTIKPVFIKSLIALSLLSAGLLVPRLISTITFEPVATITLEFAKSMSTSETVINRYTDYATLTNETFFNNELRTTLIQLIETSITNFQVFIKAGIDVMDAAFSLKHMLGFGALVRHIIVFFIGLFLTYNFGKWFIKYSFCFMDIIVAMAMFAFFFPLSVVFFIFKDAKDLPGWMSKLGGDLGSGQIKKLINAIVSVIATILTYTIIIAIIGGFLNPDAFQTNPSSLESLFDFDLDNPNAFEITFASVIVLVYVVNYIADQIPNVKKKIFEAFGVKQENALSEEMGENMWKLTSNIMDNAKKFAQIVINPDSAKKEDKTEGKSKEDKK